MMNLGAIATAATGAVQPTVFASLLRSTGYATALDGTRTPTYAAAQTALVQQQALTQPELRQVDDLNIQGVFAAFYLPGDWNGIVRPSGTGGDLLTIGAAVWKIVAVSEQWPNWTRVIGCLQ